MITQEFHYGYMSVQITYDFQGRLIKIDVV